MEKSALTVSTAVDRIFCANCSHCRLVRLPTSNGRQFVLRVKCVEGRWKKKLGEEKFYKYFTVARRSVESCPSYDPMGDSREYIRELKKNLPTKDESYS